MISTSELFLYYYPGCADGRDFVDQRLLPETKQCNAFRMEVLSSSFFLEH